ncbi:MAG: hypothetical protein HY558_04155 [Euryarchaeota archaeon]|nr:hypothetical protein [Euryarchaeota archaeon]
MAMEDKRHEKEEFEVFGHPYPEYSRIQVKLDLTDTIYRVQVDVAKRDGFTEVLTGEFHPQYVATKEVVKSFIPAGKVGEGEPRLVTSGALYFTDAVRRKTIEVAKGFGKKEPMVLEDKFKPLSAQSLALYTLAPAISGRLCRSQVMKTLGHQHIIVYDTSEVYAVLVRNPARRDEDMFRSTSEELPVGNLDRELHPPVEVVHTNLVSAELIGYTLGKLHPYTISIVKEELLDGPQAVPRIKLLSTEKLPGDFLRGRHEEKGGRSKKELSMDEGMLAPLKP